MGSRPTVVVSNAAMAKAILRTHDLATASRAELISESILFYGCQDLSFAPYGAHWRKVRRISYLQLFTASHLERFKEKRRGLIQNMVKEIMTSSQSGSPVRLGESFEALAMNVTTQMMWNKSHRGFGGQDVEFLELSLTLNAVIGRNLGDFVPSLNWFSMRWKGLGKRLDRLHTRLDAFLDSILAEHKQQRSGPNGAWETQGNAGDMVDVLLDCTKLPNEDPDHLPELAVKAILLDFIVAGTDTVAATLHWAFSVLLKHPRMLKRVQDELIAMVGPERMVTEEEALNRLPYLHAVLAETLRLYLVAPLGLPKMTQTNFEVDGFHVPARTMVLVNLWATHTDPAMWERPLEFDPFEYPADHTLAATITPEFLHE